MEKGVGDVDKVKGEDMERDWIVGGRERERDREEIGCSPGVSSKIGPCTSTSTAAAGGGYFSPFESS